MNLNEKSPPGWGGTVSAMKKHHPEIKNPWALSYFLKNKGAKPHYKNDPEGSKSKKEPVKKKKYKTFKEFLDEHDQTTTGLSGGLQKLTWPERGAQIYFDSTHTFRIALYPSPTSNSMFVLQDFDSGETLKIDENPNKLEQYAQELVNKWSQSNWTDNSF